MVNRNTGPAVRPGPNRGAGTGKEGSSTAALRDRVQRRLLTELSPTVSSVNVEEVRRVLERIFNEALAEDNLPLSRAERSYLFEQLVANILGYGPIEPLLRDESITEILVNGPDLVSVERNGILEESDVHFRDTA